MGILSEYYKIKKETEKYFEGDRDILDIYISRPLSTWLLVLVFRYFNFSPNVITTMSIFTALGAGILATVFNDTPLSIWSGVLALLTIVLDGVDGQYARYKNKTSEFGWWYDIVVDNIRFVCIFMSLSLGFYFCMDFSGQLWLDQYSFLKEHKEIVLILGMWIISNFYIAYIIMGTRPRLTFYSGPIVQIEVKNKKGYWIGVLNCIYFTVTIFLLANQVYWLLIFFSILSPILWVYPLYKTYKISKRENVVRYEEPIKNDQ